MTPGARTGEVSGTAPLLPLAPDTRRALQRSPKPLDELVARRLRAATPNTTQPINKGEQAACVYPPSA